VTSSVSRVGTSSESAELRARWISTGLWSDMTVGAVLADSMQRNSARRVRVWSRVHPTEESLGEVFEKALAFSVALRSLGVNPGDRVVVQLPNWSEALVCLIGTIFSGAVVVPMAPFYGASDRRLAVADSLAKVLVLPAQVGGRAMAEEALEDWGRAPNLEHIIAVGDTVPGKCIKLPSLLHGAIDPRAVHAGSADDLAFLAFTSGTTGRAKGVRHTSRSLVADAIHHSQVVSPRQAPPLSASPISHVAGLFTSLFNPILRGDDIHLIDRWDANDAVRAGRAHELSLGSGTPLFMQSIIDRPDFERDDLRHTRYASFGGGPISTEFCLRVDSLGIDVIRAYGSTEQLISTGASPADPPDKRLRTDGRPLAGVELRIVDEAECALPTGTPGDLWTRSPSLCDGYLDDAMTKEAFTEDGWFRTGDIGMLDADGWLTIVDRRKDIIIRAGLNISAREVETFIEVHPAIAEVAVVGEFDSRTGERVVAVIRQHAGTGTLTAADLHQTMSERGAARHKWPERVVRVEDFPRTATGKVSKAELREALRAGQHLETEA